jgi:hypothetical protein
VSARILKDIWVYYVDTSTSIDCVQYLVAMSLHIADQIVIHVVIAITIAKFAFMSSALCSDWRHCAHFFQFEMHVISSAHCLCVAKIFVLRCSNSSQAKSAAAVSEMCLAANTYVLLTPPSGRTCCSLCMQLTATVCCTLHYCYEHHCLSGTVCASVLLQWYRHCW